MIGFRNRSACQKTYANLTEKLVITDNMLCAGGIGADSCQGDSGGPLCCLKWNVRSNPNDVYQCGIVSFGVGCKTGFPGIYTDVSKYYGWIKKHMHTWPEQRHSKKINTYFEVMSQLIFAIIAETALGKSLEADQCDKDTFPC